MTRQEAVHRVTIGASAALHWLSRMPTRTLLRMRDWEDQRAIAQEEPFYAALECRQDDLARFYTHFEDLVEVLCDASQCGPSPKLEDLYQQERRWMETHYFLVRPYAMAYLKLDGSDGDFGIAVRGYACDPFQALFAAPRLQEFVDADDGNMISRIIRTREALNVYGEHLRQLINREKACS